MRGRFVGPRQHLVTRKIGSNQRRALLCPRAEYGTKKKKESDIAAVAFGSRPGNVRC